jgi:hypothetical protein
MTFLLPCIVGVRREEVLSGSLKNPDFVQTARARRRASTPFQTAGRAVTARTGSTGSSQPAFPAGAAARASSTRRAASA